MDGISRDNQRNYNYPVGIGYIMIPEGVDRDLYITTCYRKERVAIQVDGGGGVINNCYISRSSVQKIIFPINPDEVGSCVVFISPKFNNRPIIIDVVSKEDETQLLEEYSFKKEVHSKYANVSIEGKGRTGELFINVESDSENEGSIYLTLRSKNNTSKFDIKCFGDINIYSEGETVVRTLKNTNLRRIRIENNTEIISSEFILSDEGFTLEDEFGNKITSNSEGKIILFKGEQPIPKGAELKTQLEVMKNRIDSIIQTLTSAQSQSGSAATYAAAITLGLNSITDTEDFAKMNSEKAFID